MMIYSRYLLALFFRLFSLFLIAFVAFVLVCRLETIAQFATFGVPVLRLIEFTLMQIPYFLPTAIAISSLAATLILSIRLSHSKELTALRAAGISFKQLLTPLVSVHLFIACFTFYVTSELGTYTHRRGREMVIEVTGINPLLMLENPSIAKHTGVYVKMDPIHQGTEVEHVVLAIPGRRLLLMLADRFKIIDGELQGEKTTSITSLPQSSDFDHLVIENLRVTHAPAVELATLLRKKGWKLAHDHLSWRLLTARENQLKKMTDGKSKVRLLKCKSEKGRRIASALLPLTFSLLGLAFGVEIERKQSKRRVCLVFILALLTLVSYLVGKELDHHPLLALSLFFLPHGVIGGLSWLKLSQVDRGVA